MRPLESERRDKQLTAATLVISDDGDLQPDLLTFSFIPKNDLGEINYINMNYETNFLFRKAVIKGYCTGSSHFLIMQAVR